MKNWLKKHGNRLLYIVITLIVILWLSLINESEKFTYRDGVYYNQAYGYHSEIKVKVVVKEGKLFQIEILDHEEPKILADIVFKQIPPKMIKKNSSKVDAISGATYTSKSLIEAVGKALEQANINHE